MNINKIANAISIFANFADDTSYDNDDYVSIDNDDSESNQFLDSFFSLSPDLQKSIFNKLSNHFVNNDSPASFDNDVDNDVDDLDLNNISNSFDDDLPPDPNSLPGDDLSIDDDLDLDIDSNLDDDTSFDDE